MLNASPLFFGRPEAPLFGWMHSPEPAHALGLGMLICNPFGFEEVCAHRSVGRLAQSAAEAGVATLRFDYAGCGNSSGEEFDPDTLARWIASIHLAMDTLKQHSGVQNVVLLGVRLGATLAALAAMARSDVYGVIAIAPIVQGRLYLRELRILAETASGGTSSAPRSTVGLESAGFLLTQEATESIGALDLRKMPGAPAPRVLIVERDDLPSQPHWADALNAQGCSVRAARWAGYRAMMADPQSAVEPAEIIAGVAATLQEWGDGLGIPNCSANLVHASKSMVLEAFATDSFLETAVQIKVGGGRLFGIVSAPSCGGTEGRGVLLVNSGSVHSIGPNRLWVRLARSWAARGMTVLRLDLSGIGDSPAREGSLENVVYSAEADDDIATAIRYMQDQWHVEQCHLLGLCSGAFHGFKAAVHGAPLVSTVLINPLAFFWELGKPLHAEIKDYEVVAQAANYRRQLFSLAAWRKLVSGQLDLRYLLAFAGRKLGALVRPRVESIAYFLGVPLKEDLARELLEASTSGIQHFVFAEGEPGYQLLRSQGKRSLDRLLAEGRITVDFITDADHTFTRLEARDRLIKVLDRLMCVEGAVA